MPEGTEATHDPGRTAADRQLVDAALAGTPAAVEVLVDRLTPVIQARTARALLAWRRGGAPETVRQQVADLTQEIFLTLFADGGKVLSDWQPERGLSLDNYAGLVARRRALSILRSGRRAGWREQAVEDAALDRPASGRDPEGVAAGREQLSLLLARLREATSPLGWHLFELLMIEQLPVPEIQRKTSLSRDAVYAWRSRLRRLCRQLRDELEEGPGRAGSLAPPMSDRASRRRNTREDET